MDVKSVLSRLFNLNTEAPTAGDATDSIEVVGDEMTGVTGFLSYRQRLKIKQRDSTISVFVKFSDQSRKELGQLQEFSDHFCPRECLFYGTVAPLLHRTASQFHLGCISLPTVHHELVLPTGSLLVMDDLGEAGFQLAPPRMNVADARCILDGFARLQAAFWLTKTKLGPSSAGLLGPESPLADSAGSLAGSGISLTGFLSSAFETFRRDYRMYVKCDKRAAIIQGYLDDGFLDKAQRALKSSTEEKELVGLTHSDIWYNNCMIRRDSAGQAVEARLLDWQFFGIGDMAYDFGPFWLSSIDNAIVIEEFLPSVEFYHQSIRSVFEANTQEQFPVSLDQMKQHAIKSLHWGITWIVLSAETLWAFDSTINVLANVADCIEHFKL